jgi:hypothetical protein
LARIAQNTWDKILKKIPQDAQELAKTSTSKCGNSAALRAGIWHFQTVPVPVPAPAMWKIAEICSQERRNYGVQDFSTTCLVSMYIF